MIDTYIMRYVYIYIYMYIYIYGQCGHIYMRIASLNDDTHLPIAFKLMRFWLLTPSCLTLNFRRPVPSLFFKTFALMEQNRHFQMWRNKSNVYECQIFHGALYKYMRSITWIYVVVILQINSLGVGCILGDMPSHLHIQNYSVFGLLKMKSWKKSKEYQLNVINMQKHENQKPHNASIYTCIQSAIYTFISRNIYTIYAFKIVLSEGVNVWISDRVHLGATQQLREPTRVEHATCWKVSWSFFCDLGSNHLLWSQSGLT